MLALASACNRLPLHPTAFTRRLESNLLLAITCPYSFSSFFTVTKFALLIRNEEAGGSNPLSSARF
jgi:hypothetical protein